MKQSLVLLAFAIAVCAVPVAAADAILPLILADRYEASPRHQFEDVAIVQGDGVHELVVRFDYALRDTFIALVPLPNPTMVNTAQPAFFTKLLSYVNADTLRSIWETMIPDHVTPEGMCILRGPRFSWRPGLAQVPGFQLSGSRVFSSVENEDLRAWCKQHGVAIEADHGASLAEWRRQELSVVALEFVSRNPGPPAWRAPTGDSRTEPVRIRYRARKPHIPGGKSAIGVMYAISDEPVFPYGLPANAAAVRVLGDDAAVPWFERSAFRLAVHRRYGAEAETIFYSLAEDLVADADFPWLQSGEASVTVVQFGSPDWGAKSPHPFNCRDLDWLPWDPVSALHDSVRNTRAAAAISLGMNDCPGARKNLAEYLRSAPVANEVVAAALWSLRQQGLSGHDDLVKHWADAADLNVRVMIADCYATLRGASAWEYLVAGLRSPLDLEDWGPIGPISSLQWRCSSWLRVTRDPSALPALKRANKKLSNRDVASDEVAPWMARNSRQDLLGLMAACGDQEAWSEIRSTYLQNAVRTNAEALAVDGQLARSGDGYGSADSDRPTSAAFVHGSGYDNGICAALPLWGAARQEMVRELAHSGKLPRSCTLELLSHLAKLDSADEELLRSLWRRAPVYRHGITVQTISPMGPESGSESYYDRTALACLQEFGRRGMSEDLWKVWGGRFGDDPVVAETVMNALGESGDPRTFSALLGYLDRWWDPVIVRDRERELEEKFAKDRLWSAWPPVGFRNTMFAVGINGEVRRGVISEVMDKGRPVLWRLTWLQALANMVQEPNDIVQWEALLEDIAADPRAQTPARRAIVDLMRTVVVYQVHDRVRTFPERETRPWQGREAD